MAEVFVATTADGTQLAVKRILPALARDREFCEMFWDEARITKSLEHPNVVRVIDYGRLEGDLYMALEYVDGPNLARVLRKAARDRAEVSMAAVVALGSQLLAALDFVHNAKDPSGLPLSIVHRDVSPGNVMLTRTGQLKLGDFGIVRSEVVARRTQPGELKGKIGYMSPEQALGAAVDARSDLFSVGIVLAELLTLRPLFLGKNELDTLSRTSQADLSTWHRFNQHVPLGLRAVVERALSRSADQRYASAREMRQAWLDAARHARSQGGQEELHAWLVAIGMIEPEQNDRSGQRVIAGARPQRPAASSGSGEMDRVLPIGLPTLRRGREVWSVSFTKRTLPMQLFLGLRRVMTGGVEVADEGRTLYLELRGGRIVAAHDSTGQHPIGRLLLEESILDEAEISKAIAESRKANLRLGEYLVVERRIRQSVLERLLRTQMERRLASCLDYEHGRLVTLVGEEPRAIAPDPDFVPEAIPQVVATLRDALGQPALVYHLAPVVDAILLPAPAPLDLSALGLTGPETRALSTTLEGGALEGRSVRDVVRTLTDERLARPREAQFALLVGLSLGLIRAAGFGRD
jgi:serine/threonine protein kinase